MAPQKKRVKKDPLLQPAISETPMERAKKYNPIELYQFSLESEENQEIAKSIGKEKPWEFQIAFSENIYAQIDFSEEEDEEDEDQFWIFQVENKGQDPEMVYDEKDQKLTINGKENILERGFKMIEELRNLFGASLDGIGIILIGEFEYERGIINGLSDVDLLRVIQWINNLEYQSINVMNVQSSRSTFNSIIMQNFEKPVGNMIVTGQLDAGSKCNEKLIINKLSLCCGIRSPINLNTFISINTEKIEFKEGGTNMTNEEVNVFLRKWQNGEAHTRLKANPKALRIRTSEVLKLKKILKGLCPIVRDPRTTKRQIFYRRSDSRWLQGGIDIIRRTDGQVMTIEHSHGFSDEKDEEKMNDDFIEEFKKYRDWNWNDEAEDVELNSQSEYSGALYLYIW